MFKKWCSSCSITLYYFIDKLIKAWYIAIFDKKKGCFLLLLLLLHIVHYLKLCISHFFYIIKKSSKESLLTFSSCWFWNIEVRKCIGSCHTKLFESHTYNTGVMRRSGEDTFRILLIILTYPERFFILERKISCCV